MTEPSPYFDLIPRDPVENLRWRVRLREAAIDNPVLQAALRQACEEDVLFFFGFALWLVEPRSDKPDLPFCIAEGTLVVTGRGPIPIEFVTANDLVWDGISWVSQGGALCMGRKPVILAYGVRLTKDHKVYTDHGWKMACEGYGRTGVWLPDGYRTRWGLSPEDRTPCKVALPVSMRKEGCGGRQPDAARQDYELRMSEGQAHSRKREKRKARSNLLYLERHAAAVQQSEQSHVASLRGAWDQGLQTVAEVRELLEGYGGQAAGIDAGPDQPRWRLQAEQLSLGDLEATATQSLVYDLVNCGVRQAFTVLGNDGGLLLVHNCPWPHQEDAILAMEQAVHDSRANMETLIDLLADKSRAQGVSYISLGVPLKHYLFERRFSVSLISRNMGCVDNSTDPDSLMYKLDYMIDKLPFWLRPDGKNPPSDDKNQRLIAEHSWTNRENGSTMVGYAATGDVGSGGRKAVCLFDEVAKFDDQRPGMAQEAMDSTAHTTNLRLLVSTHKGDSGVYYDMVYGHTWTPISKIFPWGGSGVYSNGSGGIKIILDWRDNPSQNRLAYRYKNGSFIAERPEEAEAVRQYVDDIKKSGNWAKLLRKGFVKEGWMRSRWYDNRCLQQGATPRSIAQEIDRDPRGTVGKMFNTHVMDDMQANHVRPPVWQGDVLVHDGKLYLNEQPDGPLKLWFHPGLDEKNPVAPKGRYCLGNDPGSGIEGGESGVSAICGGDAATGEQVLEYSKQLPPSRMADLTVALAEWMDEALVIWEAQGPFGKRFYTRIVEEIGYGNVWKRPQVIERRVGHHVRINSEQYGWTNNKVADKRDLFEDFWTGMQDAEFFPRSEEMIAECRGWEEVPNKNPNKKGTTDVVYKGTGHGDRAIAGGLCWKAMKSIMAEIEVAKPKEEEPDVSFSMGGRLDARKKAEREREDDDFAYFHGGANWRD